jgi:hypothetical protein
MLGPRWFQVLSMGGGPAVVVGAAIVHTDGVDFRLLHPLWLAMGLFVAIPGIYAALLTVLAEAQLRDTSWFLRAPKVLACAPLALWIPLAPLLVALILAWVASQGLRRTRLGESALTHPATSWSARLGLAVIFGFSVVDLGSDATALM